MIYKPNQNKAFGFSLVEMAVVLVIAGLILGVVISALNTQVAGQRLKANLERQSVIRLALTNYIARTSHLPCPADPTDATSPGAAQPAGTAPNITCTGALTGGTAPDTIYIGAVPWLDLGLLPETVNDAYGRRFTYAVTASAVGLTTNTVSGMTGNMSIYGTADPALANQLNQCTTTTPCEKLAVVVLVSHGANGYGAYYGSATPLSTSGASLDELANTGNGDLSYVVRDYNQTSFDDTVMWLKPEDLLNPLIESGAVKHSVGFTKKEIEKATIDRVLAYKVTLACPVAAPTGPGYVIPTITAGTALSYNDAWGQALSIGASGSTICSSSTTVAFTITSNGIDKTLGTADDIPVPVTAADVLSIANRLGM